MQVAGKRALPIPGSSLPRALVAQPLKEEGGEGGGCHARELNRRDRGGGLAGDSEWERR